jgi:hypothetical protein
MLCITWRASPLAHVMRVVLRGRSTALSLLRTRASKKPAPKQIRYVICPAATPDWLKLFAH